MHTLSLRINTENKQIRPGKLSNNGGTNPSGQSYGFTNYYMTHNDNPIIPVVGEFHFSRFSYLHWEEELLKMKAGGVNIVATYVFWIFHEEEEGVFEWGEDRNLRHFLDLCAKHQLAAIVRIGPFCHGEVRNGGIPDWMFTKPLELRSNDELYLFYAKRLYNEIARQMKGLYYQEGGPIIAVQLENEYMHAGAPIDAWGYKSSGVYITAGREGNAHLEVLRHYAEEAGIRPLLFTVTAWGGATVPEDGTLPMLAGYAYTPWIPNQPPSKEYIFRDLHESPMEPVDYDTQEYPVAYCEMAGGMQVSYHARPYVSPESVEAMTLVKLASGSNLLGYYMYHGGSNPIGKHAYMNETALPKITYDYQSPLGEFGRIGESYDRIRSIALFVEAYGSILAPMGTIIPEGQSEIASDNTAPVRWSVRQRDGGGFVFLNNFQDHLEMPDREQVSIELETAQGKVRMPRTDGINLLRDVAAVLPFNLNLDGAELISATVQLLTTLETSNGKVHVAYAHPGMKPELVFSRRSVTSITASAGIVTQEEDAWIVHPEAGLSGVIQLVLQDGSQLQLLVLTREEALKTYRLKLWGAERLIISDVPVYEQDGQLICTSPGKTAFDVAICPAAADGVLADEDVEIGQANTGAFGVYRLQVPAYEPNLQLRQPNDKTALLRIDDSWPAHVGDIFLDVDYEGDVANLYANNRLLTDHIYYGKTWQIGLKQFKRLMAEHELHLSIIMPLRKGTVHAYVNQAYIEKFEGEEIAIFHSIRAIPHYVIALRSLITN